MDQDEAREVLKQWNVYVARKGGQSRSPKKIEAARRNAQRARELRAEKRKLGEGK